MTQTKDPLQSRTIVASLVILIVAAMNLMGVVIQQEEIQNLADLTLEIWDKVTVLIAAIIAIYGRMVATKRIS